MALTGRDTMYQEAFEAIPSTLAILDQNGVILDVNDAWIKFGAENGLEMADAAVGTNYLKVCDASSLPEAHEVARGIRSVLDGQRSIYTHVYPCHSPEVRRWFQMQVTAFDEGRRAVLIHEDVSTYKLAEDYMREQAEFTQALLTNSPDSIQVLSLEGTVLWINERGRLALETHQIGPMEAVSGSGLWSEESQPKIQQALEGVRRGEVAHVEAASLTLQGAFRFWDIVMTPLRDATGTPAQILVTARNLTDLQNARQEAAQKAAQMTAILSRIEEAFLAIDTEWRLTYLNPSAEQIVQRSAADLLGHVIWELFPDALDSEFHQQASAAIQSQGKGEFETFYAPLNVWLRLKIYAHSTGLTVLMQNITGKKAEEQAQGDRNAILEMTVQGKPLSEILHRVATMVEAQVPDYVCAVLLRQRGRLAVYAAPSLPPEVRLALNGAPDHDGICGPAVLNGEVLMVEDLTTDPAYADWQMVLLPHQLRACVSLPVKDGGQSVLGAMTLFAKSPGVLPPEVLRVLDKARHLTAVAVEHHHLTEQLKYQALHDALTGLANRQLFEESLQRALDAAQHVGGELAVLFIDVDNFKSVNDSLGHEAGDQVLREIASRLKGCVQHGDTVARISGDEFTVILPFASESDALEVARQITEVLSDPMHVVDRQIKVSASIGITLTPEGGSDPEMLHRTADLAMYHAKSRKMSFAVFRSEMNRRAYERFQLTSFLRQAAEHNDFELHYQPLIRLFDGQLTGVEALVRWQHEELGAVSPERFIPLAEETGLIESIGAWVLKEACRQGVLWQAQGHSQLRVAVNVSALQFERRNFVETVARCLEETGFPAEQLELELTERVIMRQVEESVWRMRQLRDLGVWISVDDFGTGYSSLSYLPRLPINILKIDRSFVTGLSETSPTFPVVQAILSLARSLHLEAIAEGIETNEELSVLKHLGCDLGQGHFFGRAKPASRTRLL
ncbi:EAL domain-containing protein [Deinococcus deserti]|uniref:Putative diguanylate cyclase with PAS/PAC and GAF n=1 Tax=Deinococcus deserti (strain DSM 17065 / CIP 109153 / LMG 22923 / VCD115) TaxID=546414 RepID=C1D398_DEIDV|nr:EAL domain-containing protein [Deinococcus deserti]ACO47887.1 putative diguanylate cyclase with PAS/PAC and GAF [Deinococcus deserti VCD115]